MSKANKALVSSALQLGFEYPDFGDEHLMDWFAMYREQGETPPYDYGELQDMAYNVILLKNEGLSYKEAEAKLLG
jgi:hypothetical protein